MTLKKVKWRIMDSFSARDTNQNYYTSAPPGLRDYWRYMAAPRHRIKTLLAELKKFPPMRLIELGCGDGTLLKEIRRHFPDTLLTGLDFAENQIVTNQATAPEIQWGVFDLEGSSSLPPRLTNSHDAVIATEVIEHLSDPSALLRHAWNTTLPGGHLFLSTQSGPVHTTERRVGHVRHFSQEEITELLRSTGWTPQRVWNDGFPFHDGSKRFANLRPDDALHLFGNRPYSIFQKSLCLLLRGLFLLNSKSRGFQLFAVAEKPKIAPTVP